jgi:NNP family nitrate/nitrite transporter-like MFS transporter
VGATLRIPYSFVVARFGTRVVVTLATMSLLVPSIGVGLAIRDPHTPYWTLMLLAASAGFGGGNFSAFMSSTSYFFPRAKQGAALGIQAGVGNLGVSLVQLLTPLVVGVSVLGLPAGLHNAAFIWAVPVSRLPRRSGCAGCPFAPDSPSSR